MRFQFARSCFISSSMQPADDAGFAVVADGHWVVEFQADCDGAVASHWRNPARLSKDLKREVGVDAEMKKRG